ncbi:ImmA/IrrE family metallo-endopeptidase [Candidatus Endomicrobiellum agilis]|uniref:ImmA/IrrE family metallo-endopeptidase n=1 Tax=Candidatus Endomicrobiellum agilis TaxID=3238957 RepID=UPI00358666B0|nr:ImmA/IrrE family metallo-endopeptidase [Endomicrobium sp.]
MAVIRRILRQTTRSDNTLNTSDSLLDYASQNNIKTDPLDLEALASSLKIKIKKIERQDDISGMLFKKDNNYIIEINSLNHLRRQRFTLAHELAHFCLHRHLNTAFKDVVFFRGADQSIEEIQANDFASKLVMPEKKFREAVAQGKNSIEQLSDLFQVSSLAVRVRAKNLGFSGHGL